MSLYSYLQLQPIDPQEDGSLSELDTYEQDEAIDLSSDTDADTLDQKWAEITQSMHEEQ